LRVFAVVNGDSKLESYVKFVSHSPDLCVKWLADNTRLVTFALSYFGYLWDFYGGAVDAGSLSW
ncbi:hypothetical protein ACQWF7_24955, partial [Salmonella enterica subsp. enterica serovar Infantis]